MAFNAKRFPNFAQAVEYAQNDSRTSRKSLSMLKTIPELRKSFCIIFTSSLLCSPSSFLLLRHSLCFVTKRSEAVIATFSRQGIADASIALLFWLKENFKLVCHKLRSYFKGCSINYVEMIFDFMCVLFCKLRREQCGHCDRCHRKQKAAEI